MVKCKRKVSCLKQVMITMISVSLFFKNVLMGKKPAPPPPGGNFQCKGLVRLPVDGSSRITIGGSPIIAIATDNLRLFPPLRVKDGLLACFSKSNSNNFSITTCPHD